MNLYRKIDSRKHDDSLGSFTSRDFFGKSSKARTDAKRLRRRAAKKAEARFALKDQE